MAIPQFKYFILPFLQYLSDNKEHSMKEIEASLVTQFKLTKDELTQVTPSGRMTIFSNRVGWAKTYLKKAKLIDAPKKALFKITSQGKKVLAQKPKVIDPNFLSQFSSFNEFRYGTEEVNQKDKTANLEENTPEEIIEAGYQSIIKEVQIELLNHLKNNSSL